ncbi:MAG: replication initiation protein [Gammaproteobacteria bacterium]|nr:replication initiation protein [Gammaproteobacteria bacterium]
MGLIVTDVGESVVVQTDRRELKKHAAIIHCTNNLSLLQRKISNALLYHAYDQLMTAEEHQISVKELCKLIAYHGNNHSVIRDALRGLLATVIEWNVVDDATGTEDWTASSILASVSLRGPTCLYAYSPRMKRLLHSPTMFGKINLFIQSRFRSNYGLALYENCIRYRGLGITKWFEMDTFRKLMGVPGDKYTIFRDFKRRVLDKSIEEVNMYSDLIIEPEIHREGRQVKQLRFQLKERPRKVRLGASQSNDSMSTDDPLRKTLIEQFQLSAIQVAEVIREYDPAFITSKIKLIESSRNYQQGKVKNIAGYLMSALKNDYQAPAIKEIPDESVHQIENARFIRELEMTVKNIRKVWRIEQERMIDQRIAELPEAEKLTLENGFRVHAIDAIQTVLKIQRGKYTKQTVLRSPQIRALLRRYVRNTRADLLTQLNSFQDFLKSLPESSQAALTTLSSLVPDHQLLQDLPLCNQSEKS